MPTLAQLKAICEAATPGPWRVIKCQQNDYRSIAFSTKRNESYTTSPLEISDAEFIAKFNPAFVLKLLAVAEAVDEMARQKGRHNTELAYNKLLAVRADLEK